MRRWFRRAGIVCLVFFTLAVGVRMWPGAPLSASAPRSRAVVAADGTLLRLTLAADGQYRLWTPLPQIAPAMIDATLQYEDNYFHWHPGFNVVALFRAAFRTYLSSGRRQGGSTITMQLARRLGAIDSRSVSGKLRQILGAIWLELRHSKEEILEAYLNLAPYGGNIEGVGAASRIFFDKRAAGLSDDEALTLAVIPQNPSARGVPLTRGKPWSAELERTWRQLRSRYKPEADDELSPPKVRPLKALPFAAPHLTDAVLQGTAASESSSELVTTLQPRTQRLLERQIALHVKRLRRVGVRNAAAMLLDTRTMAVKALVGSSDFFNARISGQVNGTAAQRSPGSTLKPLAYALALDQGVIHPQTLLKDTQRRFADYAPENFDGRFVGPLSATQALVRSRNVPAVTLTARLNRPSLFDFLKTAGVEGLVSEEHHGLGLVLGSAELTMQDLVRLYAALANRGLLRPLRLLQAAPRQKGLRVLSEASAFVVLEMLEKNPRPNAPRIATAVTPPPVAYKTGTSWGFRDAWCIGVIGHAVLAVWVGEFSSQSNPAFVGIRAAAPLFFSVVDGLLAERSALVKARRRRPPPSVKRVELCAVTGALPNAHCPRTKRGRFIAGRSPIDRCTVHRRIAIDRRSNKRVCGAYRHGSNVDSIVMEVWPSDLARLFARAGMPRRPLPPPGPGCLPTDSATGTPPRITSPLSGIAYVVRASRTTWEPLALAADTAGDAREVFWYVGRRLVGRAPAGRPLLWRPFPGDHIVRAVDDRGRSDTRELHVELVP